MAFRDAACLLNGLRRVAAALYVEGASEIRHALSKSPLQPVASSIYESAENVAGGVGWTEVLYCKRSGLGLGNDFPEWTGFEEGYFPVSKSFPNSGPELNSPATIATAEGPSSQTHEDRVFPKIPSPPPPPLGRGPGWNGRQYHTLIRPHCRRRWFHSGTKYRSDTLVTTNRTSGHVETSKTKTTTTKQKACK